MSSDEDEAPRVVYRVATQHVALNPSLAVHQAKPRRPVQIRDDEDVPPEDLLGPLPLPRAADGLQQVDRPKATSGAGLTAIHTHLGLPVSRTSNAPPAKTPVSSGRGRKAARVRPVMSNVAQIALQSAAQPSPAAKFAAELALKRRPQHRHPAGPSSRAPFPSASPASTAGLGADFDAGIDELEPPAARRPRLIEPPALAITPAAQQTPQQQRVLAQLGLTTPAASKPPQAAAQQRSSLRLGQPHAQPQSLRGAAHSGRVNPAAGASAVRPSIVAALGIEADRPVAADPLATPRREGPPSPEHHFRTNPSRAAPRSISDIVGRANEPETPASAGPRVTQRASLASTSLAALNLPRCLPSSATPVASNRRQQRWPADATTPLPAQLCGDAAAPPPDSAAIREGLEQARAAQRSLMASLPTEVVTPASMSPPKRAGASKDELSKRLKTLKTKMERSQQLLAKQSKEELNAGSEHCVRCMVAVKPVYEGHMVKLWCLIRAGGELIPPRPPPAAAAALDPASACAPSMPALQQIAQCERPGAGVSGGLPGAVEGGLPSCNDGGAMRVPGCSDSGRPAARGNNGDTNAVPRYAFVFVDQKTRDMAHVDVDVGAEFTVHKHWSVAWLEDNSFPIILAFLVVPG